MNDANVRTGNADFLPMTLAEAKRRGWDELDVIFVTGDAYVDHPAFAPALLGRLLESKGFRVGIIARPRVDHPEDMAALGKPRLFFAVSAGAVDSMVNNYTAQKRPRRDDDYAPGGVGGGRPNRALIAYCNLIRRQFGKTAAILAGGLEASLRRLAHYDFWDDNVRRPILLDAPADAMIYGMGERPLIEIAIRLDEIYNGGLTQRREDANDGRSQNAERRTQNEEVVGNNGNHGNLTQRREDAENDDDEGLPQCRTGFPGLSLSNGSLSSRQRRDMSITPGEILSSVAREVEGTVWRCAASEPAPNGYRALPSVEDIAADKRGLVKAFADEMQWRDHGIYQDCAGHRVVVNAPAAPLTTEEMDGIYALPFQRRAHPSYNERVPALEQVQFSVTSHRGCFGGCAFCGIGFHQGKTVQSRSRESVLREVGDMVRHPDFRGTVRDIGGPTANMWGLHCRHDKPCARPSCLAPEICPKLETDGRPYVELLEEARKIPGVKHLFIGSGVRMDLALRCEPFIEAMAAHYTSGLAKVAPEHVVPEVLQVMLKPDGAAFMRFLERFRDASVRAGKEQYVLPYFIAAHPGSRMEDMIQVALFLKRERLRVEQCQIFIPLPGTASAVMYATGINPFTGKPVFVEREPRKREMQKALVLYHLPESRKLIIEALRLCNRDDLMHTLLGRGRPETAKMNEAPGARERTERKKPAFDASRAGKRRSGGEEERRPRKQARGPRIRPEKRRRGNWNRVDDDRPPPGEKQNGRPAR